jgi:hypothetical protein
MANHSEEFVYGMSRNPDTKSYVVVLQEKCCKRYCRICGKLKRTILCNSCLIDKLKENFTKWTSKNEEIDNFIKKKAIRN